MGFSILVNSCMWRMAPRVCHYGPLTAIVLITMITCSGSYSAYQLWSLPAHVVYYFRAVHFVTMYTWVILIAKNFIQAMYTTGYVPAQWSPVSCIIIIIEYLLVGTGE